VLHLRLKFTKFDSSWSSVPDPAYSDPRTPELDLRGRTSKEMEWGKGMEGKGKEEMRYRLGRVWRGERTGG